MTTAWGSDDLSRALRDAEAAARSAAAGTRSWESGRRRSALAALDRGIAALTGARAELLLAERDAGSWRGAGDASFAAWRGRTSRAGRREGAADERRAEALTAMPGMREATLDGDVSMAHVDVVGRATAQGSPAVRAALRTPEAQARVLEMARRLDAGHFATAMAQWSAALDSAHLERTHQAQRAARFLHVTEATDGTRINGRLDRMAGYRLRLALEALAPRPGTGDERTPEQRRADALEALAEKVLGLPDTTPGAAVRPHVSFLMTEETWAHLRSARRDGAAPVEHRGAEHPTTTPTVPVTLEDGTPVPPSEVARALCDCELTRIVLDAVSEPVDLGRTARTYTGTQRRAVLARDGGCAWAGCGTPARWCEVHHMRWWDRDDGETSVANGVALCTFHHHETHRMDLAIRRWVPAPAMRDGRRVAYVFTAPDGRTVAGSAPPGGSTSGGAPPARAPDPPPPDGASTRATGASPAHVAGAPPPRTRDQGELALAV